MKKSTVILLMFSPLIFSILLVSIVSLIDQTPIGENIVGVYAAGTINILILAIFVIIGRKSIKLAKSGKHGLAIIQSVSNTKIDSSSIIAEFQIGIFTEDNPMRSTQISVRLPVKQLENCLPGYFLSVIYSSENLDCIQDFKADDKTAEKKLDAYQAAQYPENLSLAEIQKLRTSGINQLALVKDIQILSQAKQEVKLALTIQMNEQEAPIKREFTCPKELCTKLIVGKMIDVQILRDGEDLFALRIPNSVLTNPNVIQLI